MANRVDIKVGYSIDKSGLNELQKVLDDISVRAKVPGQDMNKGLQDAAKTARQLSDILGKSFNKDLGTVNVAKFNQELIKTHLDMATIKKDLENVSQGSTAFNILSSSILGANAQIKTANKALDKMAVTLGNTIRYGISSSIFNNFANSFQKAYGYARDLNESLNNIRIVTDASVSKMEQFAVSANEASKRLGASTLAYTDAALIYYQQGLSDEEARARAEVTIKAANVTGQSAQEVSEQLTAVWNGYKVDAEEAELYVDKLAAVAATTASDLEELSTGMSKVASAANLMGVDVDQLNAQLATIVSVTRQAPESVGTALKTIYARMGDIKAGLDDEVTLGKYTSQMAQYGINVLNVNGQLRDMGEVIEEIGGKWTTMSREQQIALSQVMAGTRQYNNLLSLFDNWDMYTNAIKTSQEAVGTLQHQQDIYMQSTEGHLKRLQATWEDLYDSAIDDSEVNAGIDLLNNLIQTFDNFIDSFGGGIQSLLGFGAIFSNVFNKQISGAITNFIQNQTAMQQNIDLLEKKKQALQMGSATGIGNTPIEQAELANTETQLEYAQRIREVEIGITQEQYNQLTNLQARMGLLEKEAVLLEEQAKKDLSKTLSENEYKEYIDFLQEEATAEDNIKTAWVERVNLADEAIQNAKENLKIQQESSKELEKQLNALKESKNIAADNAKIQKTIQKIINSSTSDEAEFLRQYTTGSAPNKWKNDEKKKILEYTEEIIEAQKKEIASTEASKEAIEAKNKVVLDGLEARNRAEQKRVEEGQLSVEFENTEGYAKRATDIAERVTMITSSLSTMALTWNYINSLFDVWTDKSASLGDKLTQTFMTLSMTIPTLSSAFKGLKGVADLYNLSKAKTIALQEVENVLRAKENAGLSQEAILQKAVEVVKAQGVKMSQEEIATRLTNIGLLKGESTQHGVNAASKTAETVATSGLTKAQTALNASMLAFPGTWLVAGLAAVVAGLAFYKKATEASLKAATEANDKAIEEEQKKRTELKQTEELYKSYNELYEQYQQNKATKEELKEATKSLSDVLTQEQIDVINLTDSYEKLNDAAKELRNNMLKEEYESAQKELKKQENAFALQAKQQGVVYEQNGQERFSFDIKGGNSVQDEQPVQEILNRYFQTGENVDFSGKRRRSADWQIITGTSVEEITEVYEAFKKVKDEIEQIEGYNYYDSEYYNSISDFISAWEKRIEDYKKLETDIENIGIKLKISNEEFSLDSLATFDQQRQNLIKSIKDIEQYANTSEQVIADVVDKAILETDKNTESMLQRVHILNELVSRFGEENKDKIITSLEKLDDEDLSYVLQVNENESLNNFEKFFENVNERISDGKINKAFKEISDTIPEGLSKKKLAEYEDSIRDYAKHLMEIAETEEEVTDSSDDLADTLKEDARSAILVSNSVIRMNKAINTLADNQEEWLDILKNSSIESEEYSKSLNNLRETMGDLFDLSEDTERYLDGEFFTQNAKLIEEAATGSEQAIEQLRNSAADKILLEIVLDNGFDETQAQAFQNVLNDIQAEIPNFKVGADFDFDGLDASEQDFIDKCQNLVNVANMTAEQARSFFESMGFEAEFETEEKPIKKKGHQTVTESTVESVETVRTPDGQGEYTFPSKISTKTYPGEAYEYTDYVEAIAMTTDGTKPKIKSLTKKGTGGMNNYSSSNKGGGSPGKSSKNKSGGGGSSKTKKSDSMKQITDESNRYHDIDIELGNISTKLQRLDNQKKKLFGQDLINATNEEIDLLNQQIEATNIKLGLMDEELEELKPKLLDKGFNLDEAGVITNYRDLIDAKIKSVKELIDTYNKMSAEEQEQAKHGIEDAKEDLKETIDIASKYDNLKYKEREDLINDRQKALDEITTRNIEKFNMEVEIRLDMAEAERDWNKFKREIIDGLDEEKQLAKFIDARLVDFSSYYAGNGEGSIASLTRQVNSTLVELQKMDAGQANIYGNNRTQGLEDLKKWYTELMKNLEDVQTLEKEIHESYIKMQDQAQKKFDEQVETFELIGDLIDHDMKVIQLVYGEDSYSALDKYYQKQENNNNQQLDFYRRQVEFWQKQKDAAKEGSEAWENAKEKWEDAVKNWKDLIIDSIEDLQDRYLNTINNIFDKLNDNITNGLGLEYVNEQWTLINKNAEQYLDSINALYETQALENKYLDAIDNTDSVGAQRQLKELMDAELKDLRERDKLTQYDVERANKKYEIALKQIALQEAQQNKTKMRLRRDSQGNYRYEYTSDGNQIDQMQDEINSMYNSLYNFDKARYQENLGQIYDAWSEFQEKMAEAAQINDPQERAERELLLQEQYGELINGLVEQNSQVRINLQESAFEDLSRLYDEDSKAYQDMVSMETDALMNQLVPQWESGVQQMADNFAGNEGFLGVCKQAFEELHNATNDYEDSLNELERIADEDFDSIYKGIDNTIEVTEDLLTSNDELIGQYKDQLTAIGDVISELEALKTKYNEVAEAAKKAVQAGYEYQSKSNKQAADAAKAGVTGTSPENSNRPSEGNTSDSNSDTKSGLAGVGDGNLIVGESATYTGKYYYDSFGTAPVGSRYSGVANGVVVDRITNNPYGIHIHSADGKFMDLGWIKKSQLSGYDTGGYTGVWGNDGRLALLHQKELVLNAKDTENMLNAVTIMRDITSVLGTSVLNKLAGIAAAGANGTVNNGLLDQNVNIQATFPNVTNSHEIEDALNNLVNMAAIRANRKGS